MIYLDNAATTLQKPIEVEEAMLEALHTMGNAGRGVNKASLNASRSIYQVRELLRDLFNLEDASRIAFTANATEALNIAIKGSLEPGDHVITTVLEHNSVLRPLHEMQEKGVEVTFISCSKYGMPDYRDFEKAIRSNTKAIICTHGSNLTGNLLDVKNISRTAHDNGLILIVDASQTAGTVEIDVQDMGIDILCFTGHKSLLGPQGTGGIYVHEGISLRPLKSGGSGIMTYSTVHPAQMPTALEAGTLNGHGIAGLGGAIRFINRVGIGAIHNKEMELMNRFLEGIREIPGVTVYGDFSLKDRCPIVSLNIKGIDSATVGDELFNTYEIAIRSGAHCAPLMHKNLGTEQTGAVRFSFSYFNTEKEIDAAIAALKKIAGELVGEQA